MSKPRSINIFLLDGDPNGIRVAQLSMSTIQAIAFRRNQLGKVRRTFPEIVRPGVSILLGQDGENADRWAAYIGESEAVGDRLNFHGSSEKGRNDKGFWAEIIVLVSKDENLTKSHARYVEARLVSKADRNPRWNLANTQRATEAGKLPLPDRSAMDEFVDQAVTLVGTLGCDLFRAMRGSLPSEIPCAPIVSPAPAEAVFSYSGKGFAAEMVVDNSGELVVKRGSHARIRTTQSIPRRTALLRNTLIEKDILRENDGALIFSSDYTFPSVSSAAAVVYGGSANGRILWRLPDGRTYDDWEADETVDSSRNDPGANVSFGTPEPDPA